jgi:hypothetical protein
MFNKNTDLYIDEGLFNGKGIKMHNYVQEITSAETTRNQKASGAKLLVEYIAKNNIKEKINVLDFGGGKYAQSKEFLAENYIDCEVYDPYNRTHLQNQEALNKKYNVLMCNNVLNVLTDDVLNYVIQDLKTVCWLCNVKYIIITVYERDKTGVGCLTGKNSYQRNEKTQKYIEHLEHHFFCVEKFKSALIVKI